MLISVGTRCLDEEELLPMFLANHQFADEIVIVDGGSTDRSKEIALADPKVRWIEFHEWVSGKRGGRRNPEGRHLNAVIDACKGDWLWICEVDIMPSDALQAGIRDIMDSCTEPAIASFLYYLAPWRPMGSPRRPSGPGKYEHYPELILGVGLTCWPKELGLRSDPAQDFQPAIDYHNKPYTVPPLPCARIHLSWWTEERVAEKRAFYLDIYDTEQKHPDAQYKREPLPEWLTWKGQWPDEVVC